ncbi:hypothetical protein RhiirA4_471392 [Rhizophagus irregularis]|uniref:Uncharacterized protein n=1 Tax=Rhizophagus irregularis TaxID=588596 RepID=A0A2I1H318_9GLOM|nr:hypothetical protein RhiirA4_471392 [Rhizophagus irregularis]
MITNIKIITNIEFHFTIVPHCKVKINILFVIVELQFSSNNLSENELKTALREITTAMINNDLFIEDDDRTIEDDTNNDLLMNYENSDVDFDDEELELN